jgi:hypothetical protein
MIKKHFEKKVSASQVVFRLTSSCQNEEQEQVFYFIVFKKVFFLFRKLRINKLERLSLAIPNCDFPRKSDFEKS